MFVPSAKRFAVALVLLFGPLRAAEPSLEFQVKAAFLLNFTKFVDWPPSKFTDPAAPITICIEGEDPFGVVLDHTVEGETVNGRKLRVLRIHATDAGCHVLYIGPNERDMAGVLASAGSGVLTVGEGDLFLNAGGMIAFTMQARHVRFDINHTIARDRQLQLSARLLALARNVRTQAGATF